MPLTWEIRRVNLFFFRQVSTHTMPPCIGRLYFSHPTHIWHTQLVAILNEIFPQAHATFELRQCILVATLRWWIFVLLLKRRVMRLMLLLMFLGWRCVMVVAIRRGVMTSLRVTARAFYGTIVNGFAGIESQTIFIIWLGRHDLVVDF